jgi:hypothetical protein
MSYEALKARFSESRLQRWDFLGPRMLGRLPQAGDEYRAVGAQQAAIKMKKSRMRD